MASHKESKRVISALTKAGTPYFISPINVGEFDTFQLIVKEVSESTTETFVMLAAIVDQHLYVATVLPLEKKDVAEEWLTKATSNLDAVSNISSQSEQIVVGDFHFEAESSDTPFKAIDQVFANGSAWLKQNGHVQEEEEEYEFGFDDI